MTHDSDSDFPHPAQNTNIPSLSLADTAKALLGPPNSDPGGPTYYTVNPTLRKTSTQSFVDFFKTHNHLDIQAHHTVYTQTVHVQYTRIRLIARAPLMCILSKHTVHRQGGDLRYIGALAMGSGHCSNVMARGASLSSTSISGLMMVTSTSSSTLWLR